MIIQIEHQTRKWKEGLKKVNFGLIPDSEKHPNYYSDLPIKPGISFLEFITKVEAKISLRLPLTLVYDSCRWVILFEGKLCIQENREKWDIRERIYLKF